LRTIPAAIPYPPSTLEPTAGTYRVTANDGCRVTATLSAAGGTASATLAIDADGDGIDDGSQSVPWEFIC